MKITFIFFNLAAILFIGLVLSNRPVLADNIDDYIKAQMLKNHIPGLTFTVIRNGKTIKLESFGTANLEWDRPVAGNTVFQLASSTKPLTGVMLMMLVEEGKLDLEDSVTKYLTGAPESWRPITIRHLATHSSGINGRVKIAGTASIDEYVKASYTLPLSHRPGEKSIYGFIDFVVLTDIIEKITGQGFTRLLQEKIFNRLKMNSTAFDFSTESDGIRSADIIKNRAAVYKWENNKFRNFQFLFPERGYSAGGLLTSIEDISKLFIALDSGKLLTGKSLDRMWTRASLLDGSLNGFGVGWAAGSYNGRKTVGHSGGPALSDILRFTDEKLTIIVLTNCQRLYPYLAKGIADFYFPPPPVKLIPKAADNSPQLTETVKKVLTGAMSGNVDETLFTAEAQNNFVPAFREFGLPLFASFDKIELLNLIESSEDKDGLIRRYQVVYGKKSVIWKFEFDSAGKIKILEPKAE